MKLKNLFLFFCGALISCSPSTENYNTAVGEQLFSYKPLEKNEAVISTIENDRALWKEKKEISISAFKIKRENFPVINGYLFQPKSEANGKGLLYIHWLGGVEGADKGIEEFLEEAAEMAEQGYTCLVPEGYFPWNCSPRGNDKDSEALAKQIIILRLSLDLLQQVTTNPDTDLPLFGVIGHDYGGMHAVVLAAADTRIRFLVLMTIIPEYWEWNRIIKPIPDSRLDSYRELMKPYNPDSYLKIMGHPLFFQFGENDSFITKEQREEFITEIPGQAEIKIYPEGHNINRSEEAKTDRINWINDQF